MHLPQWKHDIKTWNNQYSFCHPPPQCLFLLPFFCPQIQNNKNTYIIWFMGTLWRKLRFFSKWRKADAGTPKWNGVQCHIFTPVCRNCETVRWINAYFILIIILKWKSHCWTQIQQHTSIIMVINVPPGCAEQKQLKFVRTHRNDSCSHFEFPFNKNWRTN